MHHADFYGADLAAIHDDRFGETAEQAAAVLLAELVAAGVGSGTVVDLGCGSGILAELVAAAGYDVWGIDISPAMVELARRRVPEGSFICGSVYDARPPSAVAVAAVGEILNYAVDARASERGLCTAFELAAGALAPGGVLVFDVATPGRAGPTGRRELFHDFDGWAMHVVVSESEDRRLDRWITSFVREADGRYRRTDEHHVQRLFTVEDVRAQLADAGFADISVRDHYGSERTPGAPDAPVPGLAVFVARR